MVATATGVGARQRLVWAEQQEAYKGLRAAARLPPDPSPLDLCSLPPSATPASQAASSAPSGGPDHPPPPPAPTPPPPPGHTAPHSHLRTGEGAAWVFWIRPTCPSGAWEEETEPGGRRLPTPTHTHTPTQHCSIAPERGVDDLQASVSISAANT